MPRNIEIKAHLPSIQSVRPKAAALADQGPVFIAQDDTFFRCDTGRLKLRQFSSHSGELIFYRRADQAGPKASFYIRSETADPAGLRDALTLAYGATGRVVKQRILFIKGRTRIHLDEVEGLGPFIELEVVLSDEEPVDAGMQIAEQLMARLGVDRSQWIEKAYVDLLNERSGPHGPAGQGQP